MPEQTVVITIDEEGAISAKTDGFKGESCLEALDELLDLKSVVSAIKKTEEYHQPQKIKKTHQVQLKGKS